MTRGPAVLHRVALGDREYLLLAPPRASALVVVLHGAGGTAAWADGETGWSAFAARVGFAVALPDALPPDRTRPPKFLTNPPLWQVRSEEWGVRREGEDLLDSPAPHSSLLTPHSGDLEFLRRVIGDATSRAGADPRRVYVTGFSNGAAMAFRVAAELSEMVAAVAPVAGYCRVPADFRPARPVPTLYLIGAADPLVPVRGGDVRSPWKHRHVKRPPVAESLARWARILGCSDVPVAERDGTDVYPGPVPFRAVTVPGLGHHWPGGKGQLNPRIAGPPSDHLNGVETVWAFCRQFRT